MINKVTIKNSYGDSIEMVLRNGSAQGYVISGIEGLELPKSEIKTEEMAAGRRWVYQRHTYKTRDITLSVVYDEYNDYYLTIDQLRRNLQNYLKTGDKVELYFEKDTETYCIEGYVSEHNSAIFSQKCDAKITITCPDPWFRKSELDYYEEVILYPSGDQVNDDDPDNYLGKLVGLYRSKGILSYDGAIQNGFDISLVDKQVTDLKAKPIAVRNEVANKAVTLIANVPNSYTTHNANLILSTDDEKISLETEVNGVKSSVIGWIDPSAFNLGADIPEFEYGENEITAYAKEETTFKLRYQILYGGL